MPVPLNYHCIRRMSTITVPKQDIHFDTYDFQKCKPESNIDTTLEPRQLEADYCRDFACCGLVLNDLHDLLQHYEECHVHCEEDQDDEENEQDQDSGGWSCPSPTSIDQATCTSASFSGVVPVMDVTNQKVASYLANIYSHHHYGSDQTESTEPTLHAATFDMSSSDDSSTPPPFSPCDSNDDGDDDSDRVICGKKRTFQQLASSSTDATDLLTLSTAKKLALATGGESFHGLSDGEFLAHASALLASANTSYLYADKPYKCLVQGCDKAYKNPNGLKYHKEHGHCSLGEDNDIPKPYQCTIGECGKRYKNLNGLKYHIEHSHMAALNHTLSSFAYSHPHPSTVALSSFLDPVNAYA